MSASSVNQIVIEWLGSRVEPKNRDKSVVLAFVSKLLEIFGLEFASKVRGLGKKVQIEFDQLNRAYCEIQRNFERGITVRTEIDFPQTTMILRQYRIDGRSDDQFFEILVKGSYRVLPFPQRVVLYKYPLPDSVKKIDEIRERILKIGNPDDELLKRIQEAREKLMLYRHSDSARLLKKVQEGLLAYKKPDRESVIKIEEAIEAHRIYENPRLEALKKVEEERINTFNRILGRLRMRSPASAEEGKGVPPPPPIPAKPREWTPEEEQAIAEHYYKWPVLIFNQRRVYLWELVETWRDLNESRAKADHLLFGPMDLRKWLANGEPKLDPIIEFANIQADTIEEFIVQCSLIAVQKNLEVEFSPSLAAAFAQKFRDDESIRSDFCYFIANMRHFYGMNLGVINRPSMRWLLSAQIYYFIVRTTGLKSERRSDIFEMILYRSGRWNLESLLAFPHRDWNYKRPLEEEREFRVAMRGLGDFLASMPKVQNPFRDPYCWPLFFYLWKNPPSPGVLSSIQLFLKNPHFTIDLEILYKFIAKHGVDWSKDLIQYFVEFHLRVIDELERGGVDTQAAECLMLDPPVDRLFANIGVLGLIKQNAQRFIQLMSPYQFPPDKRYIRMLRPFIAQPDELMFKLLQDSADLGIKKPTEDLLVEALSKNHQGIEGIDEARPNALKIAIKLQQRFQFSDVDIFLLYLEIIRLVKAGKEQTVISRINAFVLALEKFCPGLKKKIIHFLFLYHPEVSSYFIDAFENMRLEWALSRHLSRFILPQAEFVQIRRPIDAFVESLAQACQDEEIKGAFIDDLSDAMRAAFFPPRQPIGDAFKISNITKDEIIWKYPVWSTHLGKITFLLKNADIGVHFHWDICDGYPVFYISFYDTLKKQGFSGAIRLDVPVEDITDEPKRKGFYMYLYTMSLKVLDEDLKEGPPEGAEETPENLMPYYDLLENDLKAILDNPAFEGVANDETAAIWRFFKKVKETYRKLFYCSTANRPPPPIKIDDHAEVAALGRIFPSHPRGALLPGSHLLLSSNPEDYLPDAPEEAMKDFARIFAHPTTPPKRLNLDLHIEEGRRLPIYYRSRSTDELAEENVERIRPRDWDERAAPRASVLGARYVTLSVDLDGRTIRSTVQYPQQCFRESNEVLIRNLVGRLSEEDAKRLQGFEGDHLEFTYAYDDQSTELLYAKLLSALKREVPKLVAIDRERGSQLVVIYDEESTKKLYDKLVKTLEKTNPKLLLSFREENEKILDVEGENESLYGRLLERLVKEDPNFIAGFEAQNVRFLDALGKVNPEFLRIFNEEEAKLIAAYEEKGVKRFQAYFDVHNLWLKQRVYEALSNSKKNLSKRVSEESLMIEEDIDGYSRGRDDEKQAE